MGTDAASETPRFFIRTRRCFFCSVFSIQVQPAKYYKSKEAKDILISSNNPNSILDALNTVDPTPMVLAIDTAGFSMLEAIAFGKIDLQKVEGQIQQMTTNENDCAIKAPQVLIDSIPAIADKVETIKSDKFFGLNTNNFFSRVIIRILAGLRLGLAYSMLLIPLLLVNIQMTIRIMLILTATMVLASAIFPKNRVVNVLDFLCVGIMMSVVVSIIFSMPLALVNVVLNVVIGLLGGILSWLILNR